MICTRYAAAVAFVAVCHICFLLVRVPESIYIRTKWKKKTKKANRLRNTNEQEPNMTHSNAGNSSGIHIMRRRPKHKSNASRLLIDLPTKYAWGQFRLNINIQTVLIYRDTVVLHQVVHQTTYSSSLNRRKTHTSLDQKDKKRSSKLRSRLDMDAETLFTFSVESCTVTKRKKRCTY